MGGEVSQADMSNRGSHANNHSMVDSEAKEGELRDDLSEGKMASNHENAEEQIQEKYQRIKSVFRLLIEEAPFLLDDKTLDKCDGKTNKEAFSLQIDGIRKALGISEMEDVDLLVQIFYKYEEERNSERIAYELEELEAITDLPEDERQQKIEEIKGNGLVRKPTM